MKNTDAALIHRTLNGDDNAFAELVKKYQKQVHALVHGGRLVISTPLRKSRRMYS